VAGAAVASANTAAATSNAYAAGVATGSTNAYNAGVVAGATGYAVPVVSNAFPIGAIYATLPAGCVTPQVPGGTYYLCGNTWFRPSYGANGIYYRVAAAP
jgi:hypothetical protein